MTDGLIRPSLLLSLRQRDLLKRLAEPLTPEARVRFFTVTHSKLFGRPMDSKVREVATQVLRAIRSGERLAAGR